MFIYIILKFIYFTNMSWTGRDRRRYCCYFQQNRLKSIKHRFDSGCTDSTNGRFRCRFTDPTLVNDTIKFLSTCYRKKRSSARNYAEMASLCRQIVRGNAVRSVLFSTARRGYGDKSKISSFSSSSFQYHSCQCFSYVMSKKSYISFRFKQNLKMLEINLHKCLYYVVRNVLAQ